MSSILTVPVEILLDVFRPTDPADVEALQLTCRRFHNTIVQNVDALPTRLVCDLTFDGFNQVRLYQTSDPERIAESGHDPQEIREMYEMFARKIAIRRMHVCAGGRTDGLDGRLARMIENFPSVKGAVRLVVDINTETAGLPTDLVLDHFEHLGSILMRTCVGDKDPSFWSGVFAMKAFRRVPKFRIVNTGRCPAVDDHELFIFVTDFSRMPAGKPRVVGIQHLDSNSLDALERRFNENIDSIGGQVCAVISGPEGQEIRYLTNMAVGSQKKTLAEQFLRDF